MVPDARMYWGPLAFGPRLVSSALPALTATSVSPWGHGLCGFSTRLPGVAVTRSGMSCRPGSAAEAGEAGEANRTPATARTSSANNRTTFIKALLGDVDCRTGGVNVFRERSTTYI